MKNKVNFFGSLLLFAGILISCGELDYENKEFYQQEVYIISSESTSPTERVVSYVDSYTFTDTLKVINDSYDTDTIYDEKVGNAQVKFKIGLGGSLSAQEDISVKLVFDQEAINDYNIEKNSNMYLPDPSKYSPNIPFDPQTNSFTAKIKAGTSSTALIFNIPIYRNTASEYLRYAFPIKVESCEQLPLSRQYTTFMTAGLVVSSQKVTNWSGFPIPKLPEGRYHSARLQSNTAENTPNTDNILRMHKYITRLGDTPELENKYMIWGTGIWSFEVFGFHGSGWMYNLFYLNDQVAGTYTLSPILQGNPDFPSRTFNYSTTQLTTENSKYDPKTKTLTIYYKNVIANDYTDVLTYVDDNFLFKDSQKGGVAPTNWQQVRSKGYKYWLPIASENNK